MSTGKVAKRREEKRRAIPVSIALEVALRQLAGLMGVPVDELQLDHDPALVWRPWNDDHTDTIPPANSASHLIYRPGKRRGSEHEIKTNGPGGEKRIHTRGSDQSEPQRLTKIGAKFATFPKGLKPPASPDPIERSAKSRFPSRKWPASKKPKAGPKGGRKKKLPPRIGGLASLVSGARRAPTDGSNT